MNGNTSEERIEKLRAGARTRTYVVYGLTAVTVPFYLWLFYEYMKEDGGALWLQLVKAAAAAGVLAVGTLGLLWLLIARRAYNRFSREFKENYVLQVMAGLPEFRELRYNRESSFTWDELRNAALIRCGDKQYFKGEDMVAGKYGDTYFRMSDVTTQKVVRRDGKNKVEELFDGQVMCFSRFDNRKISDGRLQIFQKEFLSDLRGWKAEHEIQTENEAFNKEFYIYAENEHNAFYILTPQMMERIMEFAAADGGQTALTFWDEKLYVAVKRRSLFDPVVDEAVEEQKKRILEDANIIRKAGELLLEKDG